MTILFYDRLNQIDELVTTGPAEANIAALTAELLLEPASRKYFFEHLQDGSWLLPLRNCGYFDVPPDVVRRDDSMWYPTWPEGAYLARVSAQNPETVRDIIMCMRSTDNIWSLDDLIEAANAMPPHIAKDLVSHIIGWLERPGLPNTDSLARLVKRLAQGGEEECALGLTRNLLHLAPHRTQSTLSGVEARPRIDTWSYESILSEAIPDLLKVAGIPTLGMLCDLLDQAVSIRMSNSDPGDSEDYSYIWHEAIESNREGGFGDASNLLVSAVRDAAFGLVRENRVTVREAVELLENRRWEVFKRIALHILRVAPEPEIGMISQRLAVKELFDDMGDMQHEYTLLFKESFGHLSPDDQSRLCRWIEQGPDLDGFAERYFDWAGQPATQDDIDGHVNGWRFQRLALIAEHLPDTLHREYERLLPEYKDQNRLDEPTAHFSGPWDPKSPKSVEDLSSMDIAELVQYLGTWKEEGQFHEPSHEGLASTLQAVVAMQPDRYALSACAFRDLPRPDYVNAVVSGFRAAADQDRSFDWGPVLDLCAWLVTERRGVLDDSAAERAGHRSVNVTWNTVFYGMASLMEKALSKDECLDMALRHKVWAVLEPLAYGRASDLNPEDTSRAEQGYASTSGDQVRGMVLEAVVRYALWVLTHLRRGNPHYVSSFREDMPEVGVVLNRHLRLESGQSASVHKVYGRWFPWLVLLDVKWAKRNVRRIFPDQVETSSLHDAAWEEYLVLCPPYNNVFRVLKKEYHRAVDRLDDSDRPDDTARRVKEHLAEHVMLLYLRGEIELRGESSLLRKLFANASDGLRGKAVSFVGRVLNNEASEFDDTSLGRLRVFWEWRISELRSCDRAPEQSSEASAYGWWFVSDRFDRDWAVHQLRDTVQLTGWIEPVSRVLDKLTDYGEEFMGPALDCLERMADRAAEMERWRPSYLVKPAKKLLSIAVALDETTSRAKALANKLGSQGFVDEFRDIADA